MKKFLGLMTGLLLAFAITSSASAYSFVDMIDTWTVLGVEVDSTPIVEGIPLTYTHDINDSVDFANGHYVTDAALELDFTNDALDTIFYLQEWVWTGFLQGHWQDTDTVIGSFEEHVYYGFDGSVWTYLGEVDNGQYNITLDVGLLNDDGKLNVEIGVGNHAPGWGTAYLDHSKLTGNAVPEPTTMVLVGLGLLGFAGIGRKRRR